MTSYVFSPYSVAGCLLAATKIVPGSIWEFGKYPKQLAPFAHPKLVRELELIPELSAIGTFNIGNFVKFLTAHHMPLPQTSELDLGLASWLDMAVKWKKRGSPAHVHVRTTNYAAVELTKFYVTDCAKQTAALLTKSGDVLLIQRGMLDKTALKSVAESLPVMTHLGHIESRFPSVIIPKVSFDRDVDVGFLLYGTLSTGSDRYEVTHAYKHVAFELDTIGARAKVGMSMGAAKGAPPQPLVFNEPFSLIWHRPGCSLPLLVGYFDYDTWQKE